MYSIDSVLQSVEERWLSRLFGHCKSIFCRAYLPSHDESHHYRTWLIVKQLVRELVKFNYPFHFNDIEKAIIAVFFHDTGMSIDPGTEHGRYSRKLAVEFFKNMKYPEIEGLKEVFDIIENHDDKEYKSSRLKGNLPPDSLYALVNVADDLDALGITGIFRYAEIYMLRGVKIEDLGLRVLQNLAARYRFFTDIYGFMNHFCSVQNGRYQIIHEFYNHLILQKDPDHRQFDVKTGPAAVIGCFKELVLKRQLPVLELFREVENGSDDPYVLNYFRELSHEFYVEEDW